MKRKDPAGVRESRAAWPIILVRLLVGDSNTSMRFGEHVGSIGDGMSASRGLFWQASIKADKTTGPHGSDFLSALKVKV